MRIVLYGVLGLLVAAIGGVLVAPSLIDWNPFKRDLAIEVKAATGREVEIAGNLDLALLPSPHLVADGVRLANARGASAPDLVRIKSLRADVRFWPLLAGRIEVETLRLVEPTIDLERLPDGRVNWDFSAAPSVGAPARETGMALDIGRLIVEDGTVTWRDTRAHQSARAEKVDATVTATSLSGPFQVKGALVMRGVPATVDAKIGGFGADAPVPVSLRVGTRGLVLDFSGALEDTGTTPRLEGRITGKADDLARALDIADAPRALAARMSFATALKATQQSAALDGLEFELGDQRGRGAATVTFGDTPRIAAKLDVTRLALAPWLDAPASKDKPHFALPADVVATLDLTVQLVEAKGGPVRDLEVAAALDGGKIRIDRATAQLPGITKVTLGGIVGARDGRAEFDLTFAAEAANLRGLVEAAGVDVARVPADRLLTASFSAKLKGNTEKFDILSVDARVDGARLTGGVAVAPGDRLGLGASVALDRLDLDAYLPARDASGKSSAKFWSGFDANLRATVDRLDWRDTPFDGVKLDLTLQGGALTVHDAEARDIEGASLKLAGAIADVESPTLKLDRIDVRVRDIPLTGSGALDLTTDRPAFTAKLAAGEIVLATADTMPTGVWSRDAIDFSPLRSFDADVSVASPSIAWRNWLVKDAHGRATLKKGTLDVSEIAGTLFGGPFNLSGRLETGELPSLAARLKVDGADVGKALFSTGPDGLDITGGTMALSADLTARGDSPFAIVSTLAGTAELAVHEGTVKGLDLSAVSERLKHVNDPFDLLTLGSLFTTGESKFTSLRGTFKIDGGALRTEDLTLVAPSGAGSASATADLPRWSLDAKADFLLTELKDSPPVTVKFEGALDDPSAVVQADDLRQWVIRRGLGQKEKETPAPVAAVPEAALPPQTKPPANTGQKAEAKPEGKAEAKPAASTAEKPAAASLPKADETPPEPPPPPDAKSLLKGLLDGLRP